MAKIDTKTAPRISVIERRLKQPFGTPSREIPLKGPKRGWVVRTFCADAEHPNRHYDAVHRLGWDPVTVDDLQESAESMGFTVSATGRIVRGPAGQEVLMAMPAADFERVQSAKAASNTANLKREKVKSEVAQATAKTYGSEAGDQTASHFSQHEIVEPV